MKNLFSLTVLSAAICLGCSTTAPAPTDSAEPLDLPVELVAERPAAVFYPSDYDPDKSYPLVVALHGYGANGAANDLIFGLEERIDREQFILVQPDGTRDQNGRLFWNATPECCMFDDLEPKIDDVGYITQLIDEAQKSFNITPGHVALVGHSNGGYMSYRYACEKPEKIDRIAVLAGSVYLDDADCPSTSATTLLHIHGTADDIIRYDQYPPAGTSVEEDDTDNVHTVGAEESVRRWRVRDKCKDTPVVRDTLDAVEYLDGEETEVTVWNNCDEGRSVTFWKVVEGDHLFLNVTEAFQDGLVEFLVRP